MTICKTAYDTTVGKGVILTKVLNALKEAVIKESIQYQGMDIARTSEIFSFFLCGQYSLEASIPSFAHPLLFDLKNISGREDVRYLVSDVRQSTRYDKVKNKHFSFNKIEFEVSKLRLILNTAWLELRPELLRDISPVPVGVFASWISENVARKYNLDQRDQLNIAIIATAFYQMQFLETDVVNVESASFVNSIIRSTRASAKDVIPLLEQVEKLGNIKEFCFAVRTILQNPRLEDFNEGVLIAILGSTWFGSHAREILATALEHPPTWISIVYSSLIERSFRNSPIAKISDRYSGSKGGDNFLRACAAFTKPYVYQNDNSAAE